MSYKPDKFEKILFSIFVVANLLTLFFAFSLLQLAKSGAANLEWPIFIGLVELLIFQVLLLNTLVLYGLRKVMQNASDKSKK